MDVRGEGLAVLGTRVGVARVSKKEIDHEGEAYLILCRPCQLKESRARESVVYDAGGHALNDTSKHDWVRDPFAQFNSFKIWAGALGETGGVHWQIRVYPD